MTFSGIVVYWTQGLYIVGIHRRGVPGSGAAPLGRLPPPQRERAFMGEGKEEFPNLGEVYIGVSDIQAPGPVIF